MEHAMVELAVIEQTTNEAAEARRIELCDLQLALAGGGSTEVSPY
jgi:hypothetical protein